MEQEIAKILSNATGLQMDKILLLLETPPDPKLGDLAFPCFVLSKIMKKSPDQIAQELKEKIGLAPIIKEVKVVGPYINFFYDIKKYTVSTLKQVQKWKNNFGKSDIGKQKKVMVEFPSPNTNKPLHLGHLRNMSLGECVSRLLEFVDYNVIRANLNNDRGIHICKSMLAYSKWGNNREPDKKPDHFIGDFYVMFANKSKENPSLEDEAQQMLEKWEAGDEAIRRLWKKMNDWALKGFDQTYKDFGIKFDRVYNESSTYLQGKEIVLQGLKKGIFYYNEEGAIVFYAGDELGEKVLIRPNGTTVYITQDICLAQIKYNDYKMDRSIYVVGNEQNYHFTVLFKILDKLRNLGYEFPKENYHLSYGMVNLPSGKMKSREGTVVDADDLIIDVENAVYTEVTKRHKLPKAKLSQIAHKIGISAIKYYLLQFDAKKDICFNPKESVSLEGNTGPYLQYALVRAKKILKKAKPTKADLSLLIDPAEFELVKQIASFPQTVEQAAEQYSPHLIANYAHELAQLFSTFYEKCPVLKAEQELKSARLSLVKAFAQTLKNALKLLGVEEVELM